MKYLRPVISVFGILFVSIIILTILYHGRVFFDRNQTRPLKELSNLTTQPESRTRSVDSQGHTVPLEHITINIRHDDYQKLVRKREIALANKVLLTSAKDYVPALIRYKDQTYEVKLRLKGDSADILKSDKWPFRIRLRGDNAIFGMKRFSIHHPHARGYIYEWIFHRALRREGIISPRYEFITVTLNGNDLGIYALEEHFDKILIENNRHRQAPIIKFNEDILWADRFALKGGTGGSTILQEDSSADIDAFQMNKILKTPVLYKQFILGKDLLESFRKGMLPTHKVFDIKKLARFYAISELTGGLHGAGLLHNARFYYNPITSLLEPIGFDAEPGQDLSQSVHKVRVIMRRPVGFHSRIFADLVFFKEYMKALEQISKKPEEGVKYPRVVEAVGPAPEQYPRWEDS